MRLAIVSTISPLSSAAVAGPGPRADDKKPASTDDSHDHIIVGGGTAGNALATRLSQGLARARILVIEAGPAALDDLDINCPGKRGSTLGGKYDWNLTITPQPGIKNRVMTVNRGKVLGGTSALNVMVWDRAASKEYDSWEDVGNKGWNWKSMISAMNKAENVGGRNSDLYTGSAGGKGPVHAVINRNHPEHENAWIPTVQALGVPANTESLGYRCDVSAELDRPYTLKQPTRRITARKEVILSAGAIQSPNLLELSGVGQQPVLSAAGIPQIVDLPGVGENYQDHVRVAISYQLEDGLTSGDRLRYDPEFAASEFAKWVNGEMSWHDGVRGGIAFANFKQILPGGDDTALRSLAYDAIGGSHSPLDKKKLQFLDDASIPQVELIFSDGYTGLQGYPAVGSPLYGKNSLSFIAGLMHPLSRGSVHVNPANPAGNPIIDPRYLDNEHDVQALIGAVKFCPEIARTEPRKSALLSEYDPGLETVQTDEQWEEFVRSTMLSICHPSNTYAMLPEKDGGVVGEELKVHGTTNLRVVDASVIPVQISAHIQTAVYGIAERAAEMIISDDSATALASQW
ncbi:GMC oxidoreductase [Diplogelasinospora grovesii]|uniref:GMC oxidoreductase n=1 Tax=Diplogelasinospora grovesii TaxID=303347 RepID=A0AAN6S3E7_9PEZI|nr:GMC oxidoreductase [Diplogelasinospora grovesii]